MKLPDRRLFGVGLVSFFVDGKPARARLEKAIFFRIESRP